MDPSPSTSIATYFADAGLILFALFLVLLNGFFVAAEFAMVKLRATRVETIAKQHGWRGAILRKVHNQWTPTCPPASWASPWPPWAWAGSASRPSPNSWNRCWR